MTAFTYSMNRMFKISGKDIEIGTFTNASTNSAGGTVYTRLSRIDAFYIIPMNTSVGTNNPVVNETFPLASSAVKVVTDSNNLTFGYIAIGVQ